MAWSHNDHNALDNRDDAAVDHGSGAATDGQVLTADGAGGASWEDAAAGGELVVHGATPQSDSDLRFEYGVDQTTGQVTYTAAGTAELPALIVLTTADGRFHAREVNL